MSVFLVGGLMECIFQMFLFVLRSVVNKLFGPHRIFCYSNSNGHWGKKKQQITTPPYCQSGTQSL